MSRKKNLNPTEVELEILGVLWECGPLGLGGVYDGVRKKRAVARTTVATMLGVMMEKRLVGRTEPTGAGGYVWTAAVNRESAARGMMAKLIDSLFEGSAQRMVAHLVNDGKLSAGELEALQGLLEQRGELDKRA